MNQLVKDSALSIVRKLLAIGAGYIVAGGVLDNSTAEAAIAAIMTLISIGWGIVDKTSRPAAEGK
jgi:hypothetical protein